MHENFDDISVLVVSCDKYADLWPIFFTSFKERVPKLARNLYLGANYKKYEDDDVKTICIGADSDYSSNLLLMLEKIPTKYVMVFVEDVFISKQVDINRLGKFVDEFRKSGAAYLKLIDSYPIGDDDNSLRFCGVLSKGLKYRIGVACALWDKAALVSILVPGESAWDIERNASKRSCENDNVYLTIRKSERKQVLIPWVHGVVKGMWYWDCLIFLKRNNFWNLKPNRKTLPLRDYLYVKMYRAIMQILISLNYRWVDK